MHNENLLRSTRRFQFVHDSSAEDPDGEADDAELISESDGIEEADAVNGLLGFGLLGFMPEPPLVIQGIGGTCPSLDTNCVMASDGIPAWRIATVELEAVAPGDVELYLQIGDDGMRHEYLPGDYNGDSEVDGDDYSVWRSTFGAMADVTAGLPADGNRDGTVDAADYTFWRDHVGAVSVLEGSAESFARFGTDPGGGLEPIYNAGFMGDREITLPMDNFDAIIHVGIISGNSAGIPEHGLLNAIVPEISCQSLVFLGMTSLALFRPSSVVARRSKHRTTLPPELSQANSAAQFLHQDGQ